MLNGGPVSWCFKRQPIVALSSTEAEYIALTLAAKEATWLRLLLTELRPLQPDQRHALIKVYKGNTCVRHIHKNQDIVRGGGGEQVGQVHCHSTEKRQPGIDSFGPHPSLLL